MDRLEIVGWVAFFALMLGAIPLGVVLGHLLAAT